MSYSFLTPYTGEAINLFNRANAGNSALLPSFMWVMLPILMSIQGPDMQMVDEDLKGEKNMSVCCRYNFLCAWNITESLSLYSYGNMPHNRPGKSLFWQDNYL